MNRPRHFPAPDTSIERADDTRGYWALVDPIWESVSIYDGAEGFLRQFDAAPAPARTLFAAHWCQSEVRNGGFHQFFTNSTGVLAPEAITAYEALRMPGTAALVREAVSWFGRSYPREREIREDLLGEYENDNPDEWNPFADLDDEFFQLIEAENGGFVDAADSYARERLKKIGG